MSLKAASFSTVSRDVYHVITIGPLQTIPCDLDLHSAYPCRIAFFYLSCSVYYPITSVTKVYIISLALRLTKLIDTTQLHGPPVVLNSDALFVV